MECKIKMKFPWFTYVTWFVCLGNTWCKSIKTMAKVRWSKASMSMLTTLPQNSDFCVIQHYSGACPLLAGLHKIHWSIQCTAPNFFGNVFFFIIVFHCILLFHCSIKGLIFDDLQIQDIFYCQSKKTQIFFYLKNVCAQLGKCPLMEMCKYRVWLGGKKGESERVFIWRTVCSQESISGELTVHVILHGEMFGWVL